MLRTTGGILTTVHPCAPNSATLEEGIAATAGHRGNASDVHPGRNCTQPLDASRGNLNASDVESQVSSVCGIIDDSGYSGPPAVNPPPLLG